jgi:glycosyltransferase involved in cell wall biosynthesis
MIDVVLITTGRRPELLTQTLKSLRNNARAEHNLILVWDSTPYEKDWSLWREGTTLIVNPGPQGASASRNIGASSIPKYRRHKYVMFIDDDVYLCPGWDKDMERAAKALQGAVFSGHAHPFNLSLGDYWDGQIHLKTAGVLSTLHLFMPWEIWDDVGYFIEPGGPGGSEDVEWCSRATNKGYGLAVIEPMNVLHCGLTNSTGKQIVGYDLMMEQNKKLVRSHRLEGRVEYG